MLSIRAMRQALPIAALCLFYPLGALGALAEKTDPTTGLPFTDEVLLKHMLEGKVGLQGGGQLGLRGPLEAKELLFGRLQGVHGTVISAHDQTFTLAIRNEEDRKPLNEMGLTFSVSIHPIVDGIRIRGRFGKSGLMANDKGVLRDNIPLEAFHEEGVTDYTVVLSYETRSGIPVEVSRFHLQISPISVEQGQNIKDQSVLLYGAMPDAGELEKAELEKAQVVEDKKEEKESFQVKIEKMKKRVLTLDFTHLPFELPQGFEEAAYQYFKSFHKLADEASMVFVIVSPNERMEGVHIPLNYMKVSLSQYKTIYANTVHALQDDQGWDYIHQVFSMKKVETPDTGAVGEHFAFTEKLLNTHNPARELKTPQLVNPSLDDGLRIHVGHEPFDGFAHVYLTPLFEEQGYLFQAGEYFRVPVSSGYATLPLVLDQLPTLGWQYRVDVHISAGEWSKDLRTHLVVIDTDKVNHVSVIRYSDSSAVDESAPLTKQIESSPVCVEGRYCPLFVFHSPNRHPPKSQMPANPVEYEVPFYTVFLTHQQVGALPDGIFHGVEGVVWTDDANYEPQGVIGKFAKRVVTTVASAREVSPSSFIPLQSAKKGGNPLDVDCRMPSMGPPPPLPQEEGDECSMFQYPGKGGAEPSSPEGTPQFSDDEEDGGETPTPEGSFQFSEDEGDSKSPAGLTPSPPSPKKSKMEDRFYQESDDSEEESTDGESGMEGSQEPDRE